MSHTAHVPLTTSVSVVDDISNESASGSSNSVNEHQADVHDLGNGYVQINGHVFHENWDEIDSPKHDEEPAIPHEEVMASIYALLKQPVELRD